MRQTDRHDKFSKNDQQCSNDSLALVFSSRPIKMSPGFVLGRENVPCIAEVVNRSLKADCTDFTFWAQALVIIQDRVKFQQHWQKSSIVGCKMLQA